LCAAIPQAGAAKERLDKVDDATRTLSYTVVEGDPRYANFTAEVHFEATGEKQTAATWTAKYDPVGEAGPPEHVKNISILIFKTFEKAILAKKTATHTEVLDASPDAIWKVVQDENAVLPKALPQIFESISFVQGSGEPGSVRVCKMGPGTHICSLRESTQLSVSLSMFHINRLSHPQRVATHLNLPSYFCHGENSSGC